MVAAITVSCKNNKKAENNEATEEVVEAAIQEILTYSVPTSSLRK